VQDRPLRLVPATPTYFSAKFSVSRQASLPQGLRAWCCGSQTGVPQITQMGVAPASRRISIPSGAISKAQQTGESDEKRWRLLSRQPS
jgi:hypothetical protein